MRSWIATMRGAGMLSLLVLLGACAALPQRGADADIAGIMLVDVTIARQLLEAQVPVIDVRSPEEWAAGHLVAARLAPLDRFPQAVDALGLNPAAPLLVYCRSGNRALKAAVMLVEAGYTSVHVLRPGGFAQLQEVGVPVAVPRS